MVRSQRDPAGLYRVSEGGAGLAAALEDTPCAPPISRSRIIILSSTARRGSPGIPSLLAASQEHLTTLVRDPPAGLVVDAREGCNFMAALVGPGAAAINPLPE